MDKVDALIVGAGAVGLAIAVELSKTGTDVLVAERNNSFGLETSSRNSEVIHAGIYYPEGSIKARACVEGKSLLYEFCVKNNVPLRKIGKLIVAANLNELPELEKLFRQGIKNGASDLKLLSKNEIRKLEPNIKAEAAIFSPSTGIIDSHSFMKKMESIFKSHGGQIGYNSEVTGIEKRKEGFEITIKDASNDTFHILAGTVINSAGLNSDKVAAMAGSFNEKYRLKYCKGSYFRVSPKKAGLVNRLIYPIPKKHHSGLGIHATLDMSGGMRLGPDAEYVDLINYDIDVSKRDSFCKSVKNFIPLIELDDLSPDTCGIRPRLYGPDENFRDFIINDEAVKGLPGLINLIGIESPGLTASLAIAKIVRSKFTTW